MRSNRKTYGKLKTSISRTKPLRGRLGDWEGKGPCSREKKIRVPMLVFFLAFSHDVLLD